MRTLTPPKCIEPANEIASSIGHARVASIILAGGEGKRLHPLTLTKSKPSINFGGKYSLIDIPISYSIHANFHKIFVLTQYLSSSLHYDISETYHQSNKVSSRIEILAPEQKPSGSSWFQGTADAVRQNIDYLTQSPIDYFLILSGDQLYNIDFHQIINFAIQSEADVVVAALPVPLEEATRMGILKVNDDHFITDFHEKPQEKDLLKTLISRLKPSEKTRAHTSKTSCYLGSMGIYVFRKKALYQIIKEDQSIDFGKHLIPRLVQEGRAAAFFYEGYWKDIGTIRSFYDANLALVDPSSPFDFYDEKRPIFSRNHNFPPAKFSNSQVKNALICDGAIIKSSKITHSIIGPGTVIEKDSVIKNSYLMGNSYYQSPVDAPPFLASNPRIGEGCVIKGCIIDKNVTIGKRVKLLNINNLTNYDGKNIFIRDQVIVVPTGAVIPDDFII